jgi:hypothetical protein
MVHETVGDSWEQISIRGCQLLIDPNAREVATLQAGLSLS